MRRLIGIRRKEASSVQAVLERDIHRRPGGLEASPGHGRLAQRGADPFPGSVKYEDIGCKRVGGIEGASPEMLLFVASAWNAVPRLEHINLELLRIADKGDS